MSGRHTPGPWTYAGQCLDEDGEPAFFDITAGCIEVANTGSGDSPTPVEEANARLIAAAPDMLAALEAIRDHTFVDAYGPELRAQNECTHRLATAAIAKATGAAS